MKHIFLKGIIFGIGFGSTLLLFVLGYAAWTNISTRSDGQTMTAAYWNELINTINTIGAKVDTLSNTPPGAIMAFNLSSCPSGWIAADGTNSTPDLRGEFIRGLDNGRGIDTGRTLASIQKGSLNIADDGNNLNTLTFANGAMTTFGYDPVTLNDYPTRGHVGIMADTSLTNIYQNQVNYWGTSRPRNIAFLYCIKQ